MTRLSIRRPCIAILLPSLLISLACRAVAEESVVHTFDRVRLTDVYYSEGTGIGDLNRDGHIDVVYGPYWFAGPDFQQKHEIYPAQPQPRERYADNFFSWVYDFDGDGWNDVFVVGFPGTPAHVYQNPGPDGNDRLWEKREVIDWVSNESPQFTNLVGDERPELVCTRDGRFGYATMNGDDPLQPWTFHNISAQIATPRFGHGLGVGDVNGDGRQDVLMQNGWLEQPETLTADQEWPLHPFQFARAGGADMFAYDVDGDGDQDVISSLAAHEFGLAWFEQVPAAGEGTTFVQHLIMGRTPEDNPYGVLFSELHSVNLVDMDGDGLKDIVTGKTYWSHHTQSSMWDAGAVVYWFKLVRGVDGAAGADGVDWIPYKANGDTGIGRQLVVGDVNNDTYPDIVVGGMQGGNILLQQRTTVDHDRWLAAQPKKRATMQAGLEPLTAAANMTVPEGFRVQLAAGEPDVHQPVAFAMDERGRVWVAEAYTYPVRAPEGQGRDQIIILEDTDQNGTLDSRKVFIDGLNLVSGLEVGFGGVWVGAAPYFMFIPDANGDDQPDSEPQILLDGWGYQDTHEVLNSFLWGPDGWLYGCHGVFTHSRIGKPGTPDDQRTPLNCGVWRYHPTRHEFDVFARGTSNPWGVDFDEHGQAFITACVIPHLWHMIQGARYQRQGGQHFNPYLYDDIKTIADHAHYTGNIRDHAWWGNEPQLPTETSAAGGGHAHCGAMIYLGDNWPDRHRGHIFMNNIHGNRVNCDVMRRAGSGFLGSHGPDVLLANDHWFRGINLKYGPDGSVHLIDWYDRNACHRSNPEIWDRTNGRIYRIAWGGTKPVAVNLARQSSLELVALHTHRNEWYVRSARRLLQQRGSDPAVHDALKKQLDTADTVPRRLRALWTLHVTGGLTSSDALALVSDDAESVRSWAIQLELEDHHASPAFVQQLTKLAATDSSPMVRLYLASALQRLSANDAWPIAEALARHGEDATDHNLPLMYWYGIEPLVPQDPQRAMTLASRTGIPLLSRYIIRRIATDEATIDVVVAELGRADPERQQLLLEEMLGAFEGRVKIPMPPTWSAAYDRLMQSPLESVRQRADEVAVLLGDRRIFPRMRELVIDRAAKPDQRRRALDILVQGRDADSVATLQAVLNDAQLRSPAIRALAGFDNADTPTAILNAYPDLTDDDRRDAINTLVARPSFAARLLDAVENKQVPGTDLHAFNVRQMLRFENEQLNQRIRSVWGEIRETSGDKREQISAIKRLLTPQALKTANAGNGRRLFNKTCVSCHRLFGEGGRIGPDITGSNRANLDYILENVVDPSAVLGRDYRLTVIATTDGRVVSGLISKETDSAVTLQTINDVVVVAKDEIEDRKVSDASMMPERLLDTLKPDEVRDLIAYLASPTQVALRGPRAAIDPKTGRVPGAIEGETLKVIDTSGGTAHGQNMSSFTNDRWSDSKHLWWTGAKPGDHLDLAIPAPATETYSIELALTRARDYGIVQLSLAGTRLGGPVDLFNGPAVITTGALTFDNIPLSAGPNTLRVELIGANPKAAKAWMFGLDYIRLIPQPRK